jgi:3-oxoacyl-[acyl-carrier protein] reductase
VREAFGHLDVLVANHARSSCQALEQLTASEIDLTYAGCRVVLSTSGRVDGGAARAHAESGRPPRARRITVNCVNPGPVRADVAGHILIRSFVILGR